MPWNDLWLLTEVLHQGRQPQVLEEAITSDTPSTAFPAGLPQPLRATPWERPTARR
jgi:type VI secretion system secreted protein VgrG